jgi:hypothetical protein
MPPFAATIATMARDIAWIGEQGTIKATSQQPYLSDVNGFFGDHGDERVAQGDLVEKVRRPMSLRPMYPSTRAAHVCTSKPGFSSHRYVSPSTFAHNRQTLGHKTSKTPLYYS